MCIIFILRTFLFSVSIERRFNRRYFFSALGGKLYLFPCRKTVRIGIPKEGALVFENCFVGMNQKLSIPFEWWRSIL